MNIERSKLLNRQKAERSAAQKEMKKKRGELLEAAHKKFEEMEARHEAELRAFDEAHGKGGAAAGAGAGKEKKGSGRKIKTLTQQQVKEMTKKELEEACGARGLGKKGSREDLVMRLIMWVQENEGAEAAGEEEEEAKPVPPPKEAHHKKKEEEDEEEEATGASSWMKKPSADEKDEGEEEADEKPARGRKGKRRATAQKQKAQPKKKQEEEKEEEEEDDDDEDPAAKAEKQAQHKRRDFLLKAIRQLLRSRKSGLPLSELADEMINAGMLRDAAALTPEKFGCESLEELLDELSGTGFNYDSATTIIYPLGH